MTRGYFGIGIENCKTESNVGTLWRTAHSLGASFIFTIGSRYRPQASDTSSAWRSIPLFRYETFGDFFEAMPHGCQLVGVEYPHDRARELGKFAHPEQAAYLLGAEDHGLTKQAIEKCHRLVYIPCEFCLNVAVAGSIVLYDRKAKSA